MEHIRTLVLSGGGGRGAFHAGVYKYLMQEDKGSKSGTHRDIWTPNIVVGTSIGAVNGAAIVQGIDADELEQIWLNLREDDIQGIPPNMGILSKWLTNLVFSRMIGVTLPSIEKENATSETPIQYWSPFPILPRWLAERLVGRWMNFLDTGPLKNTITQKLKIKEDLLENSDKTLLITATNVATGERVVFSNRSVFSRETGIERHDVVHGITLNRILASCSIPIVYPWTYDPQTDAHYWDGAVVANTPLGVALDTVQDIPIDIPMEVVVVLMTPWRQSVNNASLATRGLPGSFDEALTWTIDWALLSSFRERLRLIEAYNKLAEQEGSEGKTPLTYRKVKVIIISPMEFFSASRIIDYDQASAELIRLGYEAAKEAFESIG